MRYLITTKNQEPFFTAWFTAENHFDETIDMVVYDLHKYLYTNDGKNWLEIEQDNL